MMENSVVIALIVGALLLLGIISLKVFKGRGINAEEENSSNVDDAPDTNRLEERDKYEKTVPLGARTLREEASTASEVNNLEFEEVPKLSTVEKTEILRTVEKAAKPVIDKTEVFIEKIKAMPKAILKYEENGQKLEFEMYADSVNIGRDPEICHLVISTDNFLGKHHAIIFNRNSKFYITDANSKNGTYIGDEKIEGTVELKGSCKLKLAKTEIEFVVV